MEIKIRCKFDEMVLISELKDHPKNPNEHGQDQIDRIAKLFKYQGVRHPIVVSKQSGLINMGHGRKLAAIRAGMTHFPVVYQDFDNNEQEYANLTSDNAIADWAMLNFGSVSQELQNLGPDFDLDHLGIKNFTMDYEPDVDLKSLSASVSDLSLYFSYTLTVEKQHAELFKKLDKDDIIELIVEKFGDKE